MYPSVTFRLWCRIFDFFEPSGVVLVQQFEGQEHTKTTTRRKKEVMLLLEPTGQPPKFNLVNYQADTSFRTLEGYTVYIYTYIYIHNIYIYTSSLRQTDCSLILLHHVVPGPVARRRVFLLQEIFRPQETVEKHVQPAPVRSVEFVPEKDIHLSIVHLYLLR